jgi:cyclopropane fatty-acyl-phospholipid synthase-like methyltransferase
MKKHWKTADDYSMFYGVKKDNIKEIEKVRKNKIRESEIIYLPIIKRELGELSDKVGLEFGSGEGVMAKHISPLFETYHCVDVVEDFLNICKNYTNSCNNIKYELINDYDFTNFSIQPESIDFVIANNVFCHCNYYEFIIYFSKFYELMKRGSIVMFDLYNSDSNQFSYNDELISNFINLYKIDGVLDRLFQPISSSMIKRELNNIGFKLIYDSSEKNDTTWNLLGFKK